MSNICCSTISIPNPCRNEQSKHTTRSHRKNHSSVRAHLWCLLPIIVPWKVSPRIQVPHNFQHHFQHQKSIQIYLQVVPQVNPRHLYPSTHHNCSQTCISPPSPRHHPRSNQNLFHTPPYVNNDHVVATSSSNQTNQFAIVLEPTF